jgi:hypothetical protein
MDWAPHGISTGSKTPIALFRHTAHGVGAMLLEQTANQLTIRTFHV